MDGLPERIKKRRLELGMSQDELARLLGYKSRSSIYCIELGKRDLPRKKIERFAKALKTTPEYIMGWNKGENTAMEQKNINQNKDVQTMSEAEFYKNADKGIKATVSDLEEATEGANQCREAIIALAGGADYAIEALITEYGNLIADAKIYTQELAQAGYSEDEIHALRRGYYLDKIGGAE